YYTGVDERLDAPVLLPPLPDVADLGGARMLIADDVADTGATLRFVRDFCLAPDRSLDRISMDAIAVVCSPTLARWPIFPLKYVDGNPYGASLTADHGNINEFDGATNDALDHLAKRVVGIADRLTS
ncbi:MAG: hypothetical protein ACXWEI_09540, partial [Mycobacterium sp.]